MTRATKTGFSYKTSETYPSCYNLKKIMLHNLCSIISSVGLLGLLFGAIFFGWLSDKFGRRKSRLRKFPYFAQSPPKLGVPINWWSIPTSVVNSETSFLCPAIGCFTGRAILILNLMRSGQVVSVLDISWAGSYSYDVSQSDIFSLFISPLGI